MEKLIEKASILIEALPYLKKFHRKTVVIKFGGSTMENPQLKESIVVDIVLLKYVGLNPVIVHGGGKRISEMLTRLGIKAEFIDGQRVTNNETLDVVEMVLGGKINKELVGLFNKHGGKAVGISGKDGGLITARPLTSDKDNAPDLGFVGEVIHINAQLINLLDSGGYIPVISSLGVDSEGVSYNINADNVAGELAVALNAEKLALMTDTPGILNGNEELLSTLTISQVAELIEQGVISQGMIPKVKACCHAVSNGVNKAHIIDGRVKHSILLEFFTNQGIGTEIVKDIHND